MEFKTTLYGVDIKAAPLQRGGLVKNGNGPVLFASRREAADLAMWYRRNMGVKARTVKVESTHIWK